MADEEENVATEMKEMLKDIIIAMKFIGFDVKRFSIEDILLHDMNDINYFYQNKVKMIGNTDVMEKSYKFIEDLFRKYGGGTLLDVLENIYGKDTLNIVKEEEEEIKNLVEIITTMEWNMEIKLLSIQNLGNKIKLKVASIIDENKTYEFEIEKDRLEGQDLEAGKEYITRLNFDEKKERFVLSFMPLEIEEKEKEGVEIKSLSDLLNVVGSHTFKIEMEDIEEVDSKIKLDFKVLNTSKHYSLEVAKDRVECQECDIEYDYIANIKFDEKRGKYILYLTTFNEEEEEEEEEEIKPFEIDKTSSIEENFERFVNYVVDELNKRLAKQPEKINYLTSIDYLKPFVEDFVNKIQTDWIYANLDSRLALKSFALYLAEQKGLNIERFKYLKEQYINIDVMLGTIILKQKILDKHINKYL